MQKIFLIVYKHAFFGVFMYYKDMSLNTLKHDEQNPGSKWR